MYFTSKTEQRIFLVLFLTFLFAFNSGAQTPTQMNFLVFDTHPLAVGQGGAGTASTEGIKGSFYNPALIGNTNRWELSYNRRIFQEPYFFFDIDYYTLAAAYRILPHDVLGIRFQREGLGENILVDPHGNIIKKEKSYEFALTFIYGHQFSKQFTAGIAFKYLYSKYFSATKDRPGLKAKGWAFDIGILRKNIFPSLTFSFPNVTITGWDFFKPEQEEKGVTLGIALLNAGPHVWYIDPSQKDPIPQTLRLGLAYTIISSPVFQLQGVFDFEKRLVHREKIIADEFYKAWFTAWKDRPFKQAIYHFGANIRLFYIMNFTLGYQYQPFLDKTISDRSLFTMGLGINLKYFSIQYGDWLAKEDNSPFYRKSYVFSVQLQDIFF